MYYLSYLEFEHPVRSYNGGQPARTYLSAGAPARTFPAHKMPPILLASITIQHNSTTMRPSQHFVCPLSRRDVERHRRRKGVKSCDDSATLQRRCDAIGNSQTIPSLLPTSTFSDCDRANLGAIIIWNFWARSIRAVGMSLDWDLARKQNIWPALLYVQAKYI